MSFEAPPIDSIAPESPLRRARVRGGCDAEQENKNTGVRRLLRARENALRIINLCNLLGYFVIIATEKKELTTPLDYPANTLSW